MSTVSAKKYFIFRILATLFSIGLLCTIILCIEFFFSYNSKFKWVSPLSREDYIGRQIEEVPPEIDISYLSELVPYPEPPNESDSNDYTDTYSFKECPPTETQVPYWIGIPGCTSRAILKKKISKKIVYDVTYSFDESGLRIIPDAKPSDQFLLFLGCSFTFGEGVENEQTFVNLVTKNLSPINSFNLGMAGYGPNHTIKLFQQSNDDFRFKKIKGTNGLAIYTYIDDHFPRLLGSISWLRSSPQHVSGPYSRMENGVLVSNGDFGSSRRFATQLYLLLSKSEFLKFLNFDFPMVGKEELSLFAEVILQIKNSTKEKFGINKFVFVFYPNEYRYVDELKPLLEQRGITVFDFSSIDFFQLMGNRNLIFDNGHPSETAHRLYADLIAYEIKKRDLLY